MWGLWEGKEGPQQELSANARAGGGGKQNIIRLYDKGLTHG